jgi:hypothetical protein
VTDGKHDDEVIHVAPTEGRNKRAKRSSWCGAFPSGWYGVAHPVYMEMPTHQEIVVERMDGSSRRLKNGILPTCPRGNVVKVARQ